MTGNRSTDHHDAHEFSVCFNTDAELVTDRSTMMPVHVVYKLTRQTKRNRYKLKTHAATV
jgi:hypothetical protein